MPSLAKTVSSAQWTRIQEAFTTDSTPSPDVASVQAWILRQVRARVLQSEKKKEGTRADATAAATMNAEGW